MIPPTRVKSVLEQALSDAKIEVRDLTGGGDHYEVVAISPDFAGKSRVDRHRLIYGALSSEMASGEIHALALQTHTPEEAAR